MQIIVFIDTNVVVLRQGLQLWQIPVSPEFDVHRELDRVGCDGITYVTSEGIIIDDYPF